MSLSPIEIHIVSDSTGDTAARRPGRPDPVLGPSRSTDPPPAGETLERLHEPDSRRPARA